MDGSWILGFCLVWWYVKNALDSIHAGFLWSLKLFESLRIQDTVLEYFTFLLDTPGKLICQVCLTIDVRSSKINSWTIKCCHAIKLQEKKTFLITNTPGKLLAKLLDSSVILSYLKYESCTWTRHELGTWCDIIFWTHSVMIHKQGAKWVQGCTTFDKKSRVQCKFM